jgi:ClpX C4-type zinc finger protein
MIAFEITINGTQYAESEEITAITVVTDQIGGRKSDRVSVHGQTSEGRIQWLDAHLSIGDEIRIRIADATDGTSSEPTGCSFCARELAEVTKLIQGMTVAICNDCTNHFALSLKEGVALPLGASIHDDPRETCGFCGQGSPDVAGVVVRNGSAVCAQCVRSCEDLFNE